jgi:hypothetical protein
MQAMYQLKPGGNPSPTDLAELHGDLIEAGCRVPIRSAGGIVLTVLEEIQTMLASPIGQAGLSMIQQWIARGIIVAVAEPVNAT